MSTYLIVGLIITMAGVLLMIYSSVKRDEDGFPLPDLGKFPVPDKPEYPKGSFFDEDGNICYHLNVKCEPMKVDQRKEEINTLKDLAMLGQNCNHIIAGFHLNHPISLETADGTCAGCEKPITVMMRVR